MVSISTGRTTGAQREHWSRRRGKGVSAGVKESAPPSWDAWHPFPSIRSDTMRLGAKEENKFQYDVVV